MDVGNLPSLNAHLRPSGHHLVIWTVQELISLAIASSPPGLGSGETGRRMQDTLWSKGRSERCQRTLWTSSSPIVLSPSALSTFSLLSLFICSFFVRNSRKALTVRLLRTWHVHLCSGGSQLISPVCPPYSWQLTTWPFRTSTVSRSLSRYRVTH